MQSTVSTFAKQQNAEICILRRIFLTSYMYMLLHKIYNGHQQHIWDVFTFCNSVRLMFLCVDTPVHVHKAKAILCVLICCHSMCGGQIILKVAK